jgi:hypothetical protein
MVFVLTSGERHEAISFNALMRGGQVKRQGRGRPESRPRYFMGDKAYSSEAMRKALQRRGITPIIPQRHNEKQRLRFIPIPQD